MQGDGGRPRLRRRVSSDAEFISTLSRTECSKNDADERNISSRNMIQYRNTRQSSKLGLDR